MVAISKRVGKMLRDNPITDKEKLQKQQEYYKRLSKAGIAIKQTYNLKPVSTI